MFSSSKIRKLGRTFFSLMWIPFIGIFVGMIGMPDGSYDWIELPPLTRYSIISAGFMLALYLVFLIGSMVFGAAQNRSLLENGQPARATILNIEPTGQRVNDYYIGMSFLLDVKPMNEPAFQAQAEKMVPFHLITQYAIGSVIDVKFVPESKAVAIVDEKPMAA